MVERKVTAIIMVALITLQASSVAAAPATVLSVPESLKVPSNQTLSVKASGVGVQIYECRADKINPSKFGWVFKSPEADLFDSADNQIGKHYAGPTWESNDGSKVVGVVEALYNSPDTSSIPWLLLRAKSNSGSGVFSRIASIQRVDTVGGAAPAEGCGKEQAGTEIRVPYKARYYFYIATPSGP